MCSLGDRGQTELQPVFACGPCGDKGLPLRAVKLFHARGGMTGEARTAVLPKADLGARSPAHLRHSRSRSARSAILKGFRRRPFGRLCGTRGPAFESLVRRKPRGGRALFWRALWGFQARGGSRMSRRARKAAGIAAGSRDDGLFVGGG
jgi:hypothetical protein